MKFFPNKKIEIAILSSSGLIFLILFVYFWTTIQFFIYGLSLGYCLNIIANSLLIKINMAQNTKYIILLVLMIALIILIFYVSIPFIMETCTIISRKLPIILNDFKQYGTKNTFLNKFINNYYNSADTIDDIFSLKLLIHKIKTGSFFFMRSITNIILLITNICFGLFGKDKAIIYIKHGLNPLQYSKFYNCWDNFDNDLKIFFTNQIHINIFNCIFTIFFLNLMGAKHSLSIGLISFIGSFMLSFGIAFSLILGTLTMYLQNFPVQTIIFVFIVFCLFYMLENYLFVPYLICKPLKIHFIWIILSIIICSKLMGIIGIILSVPIILIIKHIYNFIALYIYKKK